jgi:hypothetical protein
LALSIAIDKARRQTATRANRDRQLRAEMCLEQVVKVAGIPDEFSARGRASDLAVEKAFATAYQLMDSEEERAAVVQAFMVWQSDERHESRIVRDLSDESVALLKSNHPLFIDGAFTPSDSDGAA